MFSLSLSLSLKVNDTLVAKSGSDFRDFSEITVNFSHFRPMFEVTRHTITSDVLPDPDVQAIVQQYSTGMQEQMKEEIGRLVAFLTCVHHLCVAV